MLGILKGFRVLELTLQGGDARVHNKPVALKKPKVFRDPSDNFEYRNERRLCGLEVLLVSGLCRYCKTLPTSQIQFAATDQTLSRHVTSLVAGLTV